MLGPAISAVFLEQLLYLSLLFAKQIYLSDMVDSECNGTGEISHYFAYQKSKLFAVDKIKYIISTKYIIRVSFFHTIRKWDPKNLGNLSLPVPSNPPTLPQLSSWTSRGIRKNLYLYLLINTCLFVVFFLEIRITCQVISCAWKPKVLGSILAATYVQKWALCSNHLTNIYVSLKQVEVVVRS